MLKQLASYASGDYYAGWSDYHCILYNGLQRMTLKPTKFICEYTTKELGIMRDVKKMWKNIGLGTLGYNPQPIYPDLVIQFLSSVELHYKSEGKIADSSYVSQEAKLAMLRDPGLRVLIHCGLPLALRPTYDVTDEPPAELSVNMGALFAQMLFERKFRGLRPVDKKPLDESIGSLLTRIFKHHDIDLSDTPCVDTIDRFDA
ncbi:hypothetical protein F2Q70_00035083 [Brassica cretica]|uniref:Arabidopsis retrotransposon Orf1 C-terminal domain-containing protein n=1 Tax=Brassica cretica TaxID=69181 RepID=A0A8S9JWV6_BRACR|nr:hypothetical protein F2Q70_00035083 [Brassica cretica]